VQDVGLTHQNPPLLTDIAQRTILRSLVSAIQIVVFDFDGVFTDNAVYVFQDGTEAVRAWRGDGIGLRALERAGLTPIILSTETNPVVCARAEKLRVRCIHGVENKLPALETLAQELQVSLDQIAYIGNDFNDAECAQCGYLWLSMTHTHLFSHWHGFARKRAAGTAPSAKCVMC
jgi:YrbI family 3-deoxy-D-manno-octulosonate 8-phosphate phosphatase